MCVCFFHVCVCMCVCFDVCASRVCLHCFDYVALELLEKANQRPKFFQQFRPRILTMNCANANQRDRPDKALEFAAEGLEALKDCYYGGDPTAALNFHIQVTEAHLKKGDLFEFDRTFKELQEKIKLSNIPSQLSMFNRLAGIHQAMKAKCSNFHLLNVDKKSQK